MATVSRGRREPVFATSPAAPLPWEAPSSPRGAPVFATSPAAPLPWEDSAALPWETSNARLPWDEMPSTVKPAKSAAPVAKTPPARQPARQVSPGRRGTPSPSPAKSPGRRGTPSPSPAKSPGRRGTPSPSRQAAPSPSRQAAKSPRNGAGAKAGAQGGKNSRSPRRSRTRGDAGELVGDFVEEAGGPSEEEIEVAARSSQALVFLMSGRTEEITSEDLRIFLRSLEIGGTSALKKDELIDLALLAVEKFGIAAPEEIATARRKISRAGIHRASPPRERRRHDPDPETRAALREVVAGALAEARSPGRRSDPRGAGYGEARYYREGREDREGREGREDREDRMDREGRKYREDRMDREGRKYREDRKDRDRQGQYERKDQAGAEGNWVKQVAAPPADAALGRARRLAAVPTPVEAAPAESGWSSTLWKAGKGLAMAGAIGAGLYFLGPTALNAATAVTSTVTGLLGFGSGSSTPAPAPAPEPQPTAKPAPTAPPARMFYDRTPADYKPSANETPSYLPPPPPATASEGSNALYYGALGAGAAGAIAAVKYRKELAKKAKQAREAIVENVADWVGIDVDEPR